MNRHISRIAMVLLSCLAASSAADLSKLRCEYRDNPLGIDAEKPLLSWVMEDGGQRAENRGQQQSAYQVLVAATPELLAKDQGDLWDSKKVESDQSIQVEYAGRPLEPRMVCHWKVRIWAKDGRVSAWSKPAGWSMGLLKPDDWQAKWVKAGGDTSPWLRKEFTLTAVPERAMAFVNVKGYYELYVNGKKVSDDVLAPAVTQDKKRSLYTTYDISKYLRAGSNCVGLWLGRGWIKTGAIARVQLDMAVGGQRVVVGTDATWTSMASTHELRGPWEWSNMGGETIDARKEIAGWNEVGCLTGAWLPVAVVASPEGVATAQACPPNKINKVIPMTACTNKGANIWELDFGTNLTGWLRLHLPKLAAGQHLTISYADKPGQTFQQVDEYISAGKPAEVFCSKFNYHGFRYAIVDGLADKPAPGDAEALLIESDLDPVGNFECSNDLFNRIHQLNLWTIRCLSLGGYMVDCPHRERLGYGDGQTSLDTQIMNRNAPAFYAKWTIDWLDAQDPGTGQFPHTAPFVIPSWGGPGWGGIAGVLPWKNFLYYGDLRLLEHCYGPMRRYSEFLDGQCKDGVLRQTGEQGQFLGDWVPPERGMDTQNWPGQTACELFNNGYRVYLWQILERSARFLGKTKDADDYAARIQKIRPLIHAAFYDPQKQLYVIDEQAYQVMPLLAGIVPDALVGTVQKKLEDLILVKSNGHLDTGMLGTYFLIQYLQEAGRNDLLYTIFNQQTYPGWGYMLAQGATTMWEQWNGYYSHIHSCFASPGSWFYQGLAGIRSDESGPGFRKIIIKPAIVGDLTWVKCGYESIHGKIISNWQRDGDKLTMDVTIPANTTATVHVPAKDEADVTESGKPASKADGVTFLRMEHNAAVYAVGSGTYRFQATLKSLK
ncbi:MAG: family 78 glycoside hydrolase catalytic domain [Verrucomicrobia bacterium]|nr:family 78 glycoside hydrolase catalytic domain [Verrucomicrobiota bacterium]